jgi:hypothetical protein
METCDGRFVIRKLECKNLFFGYVLVRELEFPNPLGNELNHRNRIT